MAMKDYSEEFRADAAALYESTPGATYKGIAANLGVSRGALRIWVLAARGTAGGRPSRPRGIARRECGCLAGHPRPRPNGSASLRHGFGCWRPVTQAGERARHRAAGREVFRGRTNW